MANKYTKALKQIKSTQIDEKIKKLDEKSLLNEAPPTNSMSGVYALNDPGWHNTKPEPPRVFLPDKDGNWPAGIPANPGDKTYTRPAGYWDGSRDWETIEKPVASNSNIGADGKNTKGLIDDETGYVKTDLPDGTRGFVLGPLVDNYVYLHGYDAYCNIGYMQKDTRQFVLLGRVNGRWNTDVHPIPSGYAGYGWGEARVWDGSESGFTSYNPSFTHAHALWFKEQIDSRKYGSNVAYFYSGGVPAQNNPGEYSNLPQWLQDLLEGMKGGLLAGLGKLMDGNAAVAGAGANPNDPLQGFGQGGDPDQITPGKEHTQGDPKTGDSGDANLWGQLFDKAKKKSKEFLDDLVDSGKDAVDKAKDYVKDIYDEIDQFTDKLPALEYSKNIAGSILDNKPIDKSDTITQEQKTKLLNNLNLNDLKFSDGKPTPYADDNIITDENGNVRPRAEWPKDKDGNDLFLKKGDPGYEQYRKDISKWNEDHINHPNNTATVTNQSEEELGAGFNNPLAAAGQAQTQIVFPEDGSEPYFKYTDHAYLNNKSADPGEVPDIGKDILSKIVSQIGDRLHRPQGKFGAYTHTDSDAPNTGEMKGYPPNIRGDVIKEFEVPYSELPPHIQKYVDQQRNNQSSSNMDGQQVSTVPSGPNSPLPAPGWTPRPGSNFRPGSIWNPPKPGGGTGRYGTSIKLAHHEPEGQVLSESRSRILREIKQPVEVKEEPIQKLKKYRPNFKGKYRPQNTPDVTASPKSDQLVASGNQKGQAWRTKDKYWSGFESTERMNVIYDRVGHGNQAWEQIIEDAKKKNGWKNREIQEQINRYYALEAERKQGLIQETSQNEREDNFDKVVKLKSIIGNLKTWQGDIKPEYPDEKPPELGPDGFHPQLGKKKDYYKRLDSVSAVSMPKTGDPETDATVDQQKKKYVQPKVAEDTRFNWRDSLTNS